MFIVNESEKEYRFGNSGPKYLMKGPRMNFAVVQFQPGEDFKAHYHNIMEEDFFILEGEIDIVVDGTVHHLKQGDLIPFREGPGCGYGRALFRCFYIADYSLPSTLYGNA